MPRRKITLSDITIADAFAKLESAGIQIQVKAVTDTEPEQYNIPMPEPAPYSDTKPVGKTTTKVTLYARHSIGSGGTLTVTADSKQIEHAGVESYGPGVCYVPTKFAQQLLHQDAIARQADNRMLDRQQRCYIVAPRIGNDGQRCNIGIQVDEGMYGDIGNLPAHMTHIIR